MPSKDRVRRKRQKNVYTMKRSSILEKKRLHYEKNASIIKAAQRHAYAANPRPKIEAAKRASKKSYAANPLPKIEAAKRASQKSYASKPLPKMQASYNNYHKNPQIKRAAAIVRHSKK